jgi:hypothetical protein
VTQFLVAGERGWLTAHQPTKNQAMHPSLFTHLLGARWQGSGRRRRQAATAPIRGGNKDTGGISNGKGRQQSTIKNQLKATAATATETAKTAMMMNEKRQRRRQQKRGSSAAAAGVAAQLWGQQQHCGGGGVSVAVAVVAWWWQKHGNRDGSSAATAWQWQCVGGSSQGSLAAALHQR